jgi:hypothetical protein
MSAFLILAVLGPLLLFRCEDKATVDQLSAELRQKWGKDYLTKTK